VGGVDHRLPDGTALVIRPIRPGDKALLVDGLARLSPRSARMRFLAPKNHLTLAELRYLTEIDYVDHYALVAVRADDPRCLAGVGRWVRDAHRPDRAEVAIVVGDELQGKGLGTTLGELLAEAAVGRGVEHFTATMLAENAPAQRLFAHIYRLLEKRLDGANYELVAALAA
jgi:RimJ/RimL family protein N-acetyltransferase